MPSIVHVVATGNFAGVERYVCDVASETARRGWGVSVVGGSSEQMQTQLGAVVRWLPGSSPSQALWSLLRLGRLDFCHVHMSLAEVVGLLARPRHRGMMVSTRHFAAVRGSSRSGRLLAPWIASRLDREIAISEFVARHLERPPQAVVPNGVPPSPSLWRAESRTVLVAQRLEAEKGTMTALRAWKLSNLASDGWSLRVVGDGAKRTELERWARSEQVAGVTFVGWVPSVVAELAAAGIFLAPAPAEPFGLAVVEAMAAGVPVVAAAAGGHMETVGQVSSAPMFPVGDAAVAAAQLRSLVDERVRAALSLEMRDVARTRFSLTDHVDHLLSEYKAAQVGATDRAAGTTRRRRLAH